MDSVGEFACKTRGKWVDGSLSSTEADEAACREKCAALVSCRGVSWIAKYKNCYPCSGYYALSAKTVTGALSANDCVCEKNQRGGPVHEVQPWSTHCGARFHQGGQLQVPG